jgi:hypothetical protein
MQLVSWNLGLLPNLKYATIAVRYKQLLELARFQPYNQPSKVTHTEPDHNIIGKQDIKGITELRSIYGWHFSGKQHSASDAS